MALPKILELDRPAACTTRARLRPISFYAQHLRQKLPASIFQTTPARLVWIPIFGSIAALALYGICMASLAWPIQLALGLIVGTCYGGLGFLGHEILHGAIVKNRKLQDVLGLFCFMPFFISPTFWRGWHNQMHHGKTQIALRDPDAFPTLRIFKQSRFMKIFFPFTPGAGTIRSYFYFFFWFSFQVFVSQVYRRFHNSAFEKMNHRRVTLEFTCSLLMWGGFLFWLGPTSLLWTLAIPFIAQNYFVMSYIATNHNLCPLTSVNDPLVNSLTVTNHPLLEALHLNFGYHVGHHILPTISGRHAKLIHRELLRAFPADYQVMSKGRALKAIYRTARIYKNSTTLINPLNEKIFPTLSTHASR